jgi:hypothetical protein
VAALSRYICQSVVVPFEDCFMLAHDQLSSSLRIPNACRFITRRTRFQNTQSVGCSRCLGTDLLSLTLSLSVRKAEEWPRTEPCVSSTKIYCYFRRTAKRILRQPLMRCGQADRAEPFAQVFSRHLLGAIVGGEAATVLAKPVAQGRVVP